MQLSAQKSNISRASLRDQVRDILMEQILTGQLKPGDRLKEMHIANSLGVSQAPVREAIRYLEALGFLEHVPNAGTRVKTFSIDKLIEVYQVREALEITAVRIAFENIKKPSVLDASVKMLEAAFEKMNEAAVRDDASDYAKHNTKFHRIFLKMSGNETLLDVWESLAIQTRVLQTMFGTHLSLVDACQLHSGILAALKSGDKKAILHEIYLHYKSIREYHEQEY